MAFKSATEYWQHRKARDAARKAAALDTMRVEWLNRKCSQCGGPVTTNGYCVNDITKCRRAYTD